MSKMFQPLYIFVLLLVSIGSAADTCIGDCAYENRIIYYIMKKDVFNSLKDGENNLTFQQIAENSITYKLCDDYEKSEWYGFLKGCSHSYTTDDGIEIKVVGEYNIFKKPSYFNRKNISVRPEELSIEGITTLKIMASNIKTKKTLIDFNAEGGKVINNKSDTPYEIYFGRINDYGIYYGDKTDNRLIAVNKFIDAVSSKDAVFLKNFYNESIPVNFQTENNIEFRKIIKTEDEYEKMWESIFSKKESIIIPPLISIHDKYTTFMFDLDKIKEDELPDHWRLQQINYEIHNGEMKLSMVVFVDNPKGKYISGISRK